MSDHYRSMGWLSVLFVGLGIFCANFAASNVAEGRETSELTGKGEMLSKKVTVVSVPYLSFLEWEELSQMPHLSRLAHSGQIAALNVRTKGSGLEDSYATLGAGAQTVSTLEIQGYHRDEMDKSFTAFQWYAVYRGSDKGMGEVIVPRAEAIRYLNESERYGAEPGMLGELLRNHGIRTTVLGNSDLLPDGETEGGKRRFAPLMLMDKNGIVDGGDVGPSTMQSKGFGRLPGTNYAYLHSRWQDAVRPGVVLIELGDLYRLYREKNRFSPERFALEKREILQEVDHFVGSLAARMEDGDSLWLFSPLVHPDAQEEKMLLAPLFHHQKGSAAGTLVSPTTRRPGIVAAVDVAPTLLAEFQLTPSPTMIGFPLKNVPRQDTWAWLAQELKDAATVYKLRPNVLYPFVVFEIILLLLGLVVVLKNWQRHFPFLPFLMYVLLAAPLALLVLGWMRPFSPLTWMVLFVLMLVLIAAVSVVRSPAAAFTALGGATAGLILWDTLTGAEGMKRSILGYDSMIGARYYGIGNEYMGILVGAVVLLASSVLHQWEKGNKKTAWFFGFFFAFVFLFFAAPQGGANAGGALTASVALGFLWFRSFVDKKSVQLAMRRLVTTAVSFTGAALGGLWVINGLSAGREETQSHIGRAFGHLMSGDWGILWQIALRKWEMNWHLIGVSWWGKLLMTALFVMAVLLLRPRGLFQRWMQKNPYLMHGFTASTLGAIVALFTNDSGIVAAATMIVYVVVPMLLLAFYEEASSSHWA